MLLARRSPAHAATVVARRAALLASIGFAGGCSSSAAPAAPGCTLQSSGGVTASTALPSGCAAVTLSSDAGASPGFVLTASASTAEFAGLVVEVDLGPSPEPGPLSSEGIYGWSAVGFAGADADAGCAYFAGSAAVPPGSFSLTLNSLDLGAGIAHGTLSFDMYLHAPPATDCASGDVANVVLSF